MRAKALIIFLYTGLVLSLPAISQKIDDGIVDVRGVDLSTQVIRLSGTWEFYPAQLLAPNEIATASRKYALFPATWKNIDFATYHLRALVDKDKFRKGMAIDMPAVFSAYTLWINGKFTGINGKAGTTKETTAPGVRPSVYTFDISSDTIDFVLQIANFYHAIGGTQESIYLSSQERMEARVSAIKTTDYILFITLIIIGITSLCFYYVTYKNKAPFLCLSLFVFVWCIRSAFCNQYRILDWIDIDWFLMKRIEYCGIYFTTIMALLFLSSLFPQDFTNKKLKAAFIIICSLFSLFTLFTEPLTFTRYLWLYLTVSIGLVAYVIYIIIKAFVHERGGAAIMLISIFGGALAFGYVIVAYVGLIELNMLVYNIGFITLYAFLTVSMSVRISKMDAITESDVLTMEHFYRKD